MFKVGDRVRIDSIGQWADGQIGTVTRAKVVDNPWAKGFGEGPGSRDYSVEVDGRNFEANDYEVEAI